MPLAQASATCPVPLAQAQPLPEGHTRVSLAHTPWGPCRGQHGAPRPPLPLSTQIKPNRDPKHSNFLNLEMNTNLPAFQNLQPSWRLTPSEGKAASKQIQAQTLAPSGVRPNLVPPHFRSWFQAFECDEGAEGVTPNGNWGTKTDRRKPWCVSVQRQGLSQPQGSVQRRSVPPLESSPEPPRGEEGAQQEARSALAEKTSS